MKKNRELCRKGPSLTGNSVSVEMMEKAENCAGKDHHSQGTVSQWTWWKKQRTVQVRTITHREQCLNGEDEKNNNRELCRKGPSLTGNSGSMEMMKKQKTVQERTVTHREQCLKGEDEKTPENCAGKDYHSQGTVSQKTENCAGKDCHSQGTVSQRRRWKKPRKLCR